MSARPPAGPFAMYLADTSGAFRFIAFDLDAKRAEGGAAAVREDAALLAQLLDEAGLAFLVASSGPTGGLHLWVPVNDPRVAGAPAALVRRIARAAARRCPTLDVAPLLNVRTGCVRPPGAPHRAGGYSRLIEPVDPAAAAAYCSAANSISKLEKLADLLGAASDEEDPDAAVAVAGSGGLVDTEAVRLVGRRRPMSPSTAALLAQAPSGDASAHLARIFTGLALARWSATDVERLVAEQPHAPGLEHLRTNGNGGRGRRVRGVAEQRATVGRQWARMVAFAARLPRREQTSRDTPEVRALVERTAAIREATHDAAWWHKEAGPSDRKAILFVAMMALEALSDTVEVDCRRLADACGMTPSTASRALRRLILDGRLVRAVAGEGRRAHAYRLVPVQDWTITRVRDLPDQSQSAGGTQATPAPVDAGPTLSREALLGLIRSRLEHAAHDVWTEPGVARTGGLGRHLEATAAALVEDTDSPHPYDVNLLVTRTGHRLDRLLAHVTTLGTYGLVRLDEHERLRPAPERYDRAARRLRTAGTRARRWARYEAERLAYAAWCDELARLRAPRGSVAAMFAARRRYPRTDDGRPDHAVARRQALAAA